MEFQALAGIAQGGGKIVQGGFEQSAAKREARAVEDAAAVEAAGLRERAKEERGAAAMSAREKRRETDKLIGRQVALAADSGGGTGGTILDIIGETSDRGTLQKEIILATGESRARGLEDKANLGVWQAGTRAKSLKQKGDAMFMNSIFEGGSKIVDSTYKYGDRKGWWDSNTASSDETDPRTGWRTRVYRSRG